MNLAHCYKWHMNAPLHDWYLRQWLESTHTTQAALCRATGWDKRKASFLVNGRQPYSRGDVDEAALALNIEPFELLMHPEDAFALRRMRRDAIHIAAERRNPWRGFDADTPDDEKGSAPRKRGTG